MATTGEDGITRWSGKRGSKTRHPPWQEGALAGDVKGCLGIKELSVVPERPQASASILRAPFELVFELAPDIPRSLDISKAPVAILGPFGELTPISISKRPSRSREDVDSCCVDEYTLRRRETPTLQAVEHSARMAPPTAMSNLSARHSLGSRTETPRRILREARQAPDSKGDVPNSVSR